MQDEEKTFLKIIASVCLIAYAVSFLFPILCLENSNETFCSSVKVFSSTKFLENLYNAHNGEFYTFPLVFNYVLAVLGLLVAIGYGVFFVLETRGVEFKYFNLIELIMVISMIAIGVLIIIFTVIACLLNKITLSDQSQCFLTVDSGFYMQLFLIPAGIVGLVACCRQKLSNKKKNKKS